MGLFPIEWVKREKTTPSHRPRGASRPGPGQLSSGRGRPGKLKIFLKPPLDWEKTLINILNKCINILCKRFRSPDSVGSKCVPDIVAGFHCW
jgi:hypothetical protein